MTEEQKPSNEEKQNHQKIRPDLINTAANFLLNPSVINKADEHKTAFLRKKGLTEAEISLAYKKAEKDPNYKQILQSSNMPNTLPVPPPVPVYRPLSFWSQLSQFSSSLIVLGVAIFGAHYIYKKYIEPLIFGEDNENKPKKLEKQLMDMANSLMQLEKHVSCLEGNINHQKEQMDKLIQNEFNEYYPTPLALREIKMEISSVKSMLLNRHQFPALPKVTPTPTIPHWQLPSNETGDDTSKQNSEIKDQYEEINKESDLNQDKGEVLEVESTSAQINGTNDVFISEAESVQQECSGKND